MFLINGGWYNFLIAIIIIIIPICYSGDYYSFDFVNKHYDPFYDDHDRDWDHHHHEGANWVCLVLGFCSPPFQPVVGENPGLGLIFKWTQLEFDYNSQQERQFDIDREVFKPGTPAPIDMDVHYSNNKLSKVFITIPRFQAGIPATLGYVSDKKMNGNPIIVPYPSWSWHRSPESCSANRIVSVYRIQIDECNRLWVLDTGRLIEDQICPPQILAFDLNTDKLVHKYEIPKSQLESRSILVTPVVDIRDHKCDEAFVYVADCQTYSIIVHDVKRQTSWQVTDKTMYPYPNFGTFSIQGESFDLMDGVLGMALEPYQRGQDRKLFYHAMSSGTENWVYTSDLQNETRFLHDPESSPEIFHVFKGRRNSQSAAEAMDKNGIMYYGTMSDTSINCWDTHFEYGQSHSDVVAFNMKTLQFASGIKVVTHRSGHQELWVITSRFQKVATGTLTSSETNFRIQAGKVDDLIFGTKCINRQNYANGPHHGGNGGGGGFGLVKPPRPQYSGY